LFLGLKILRQRWCASSSLASGTIKKFKGLSPKAKPLFYWPNPISFDVRCWKFVSSSLQPYTFNLPPVFNDAHLFLFLQSSTFHLPPCFTDVHLFLQSSTFHLQPVFNDVHLFPFRHSFAEGNPAKTDLFLFHSMFSVRCWKFVSYLLTFPSVFSLKPSTCFILFPSHPSKNLVQINFCANISYSYLK